MFVILGATGNTGGPLVRALLAQGRQVRVVARNPERLRSLAQAGGEAVSADLRDSVALTQALQGAEAAYVMLPANPASRDFRAEQERASDAIASAVAQARVPYVVTLSSIGADKPAGTGPVVGLNHMELKLNIIPGLNTMHLRAGYFMENTLGQAGVIPKLGAVAGPLPAELKLPMIATQDIAAAACEELLRVVTDNAWRGHQKRELLGPEEISYADVATIIGAAIGKPGLKYVRLSEQQMQAAAADMGWSESFCKVLMEMASALTSGHMAPLEARNARNTTPTKYDAFVREYFLPAFRQRSHAA